MVTGYSVHYAPADADTVADDAAEQTDGSPSVADGWVAVSRCTQAGYPACPSRPESRSGRCRAGLSRLLRVLALPIGASLQFAPLPGRKRLHGGNGHGAPEAVDRQGRWRHAWQIPGNAVGRAHLHHRAATRTLSSTPEAAGTSAVTCTGTDADTPDTGSSGAPSFGIPRHDTFSRLFGHLCIECLLRTLALPRTGTGRRESICGSGGGRMPLCGIAAENSCAILEIFTIQFESNTKSSRSFCHL